MCLFLRLVLEMSKRAAPDVASWKTSITNASEADSVLAFIKIVFTVLARCIVNNNLNVPNRNIKYD